MTRQHVTVALNGDGGDEAFAGYPWHLANRVIGGWQGVPASLRRGAERAAQAILPSSADRRSFVSRPHRCLRRPR